MNKQLFRNLTDSLSEAVEIHNGRKKPSRIFSVTPPDIQNIRKSLEVSQNQFAHMIGVSEGTLKNWEQGRRTPAGPAMVLLKVLSRNPEAVFRALR